MQKENFIFSNGVVNHDFGRVPAWNAIY